MAFLNEITKMRTFPSPQLFSKLQGKSKKLPSNELLSLNRYIKTITCHFSSKIVDGKVVRIR